MILLAVGREVSRETEKIGLSRPGTVQQTNLSQLSLSSKNNQRDEAARLGLRRAHPLHQWLSQLPCDFVPQAIPSRAQTDPFSASLSENSPKA